MNGFGLNISIRVHSCVIFGYVTSLDQYVTSLDQYVIIDVYYTRQNKSRANNISIPLFNIEFASTVFKFICGLFLCFFS